MQPDGASALGRPISVGREQDGWPADGASGGADFDAVLRREPPPDARWPAGLEVGMSERRTAEDALRGADIPSEDPGELSVFWTLGADGGPTVGLKRGADEKTTIGASVEQELADGVTVGLDGALALPAGGGTTRFLGVQATAEDGEVSLTAKVGYEAETTSADEIQGLPRTEAGTLSLDADLRVELSDDASLTLEGEADLPEGADDWEVEAGVDVDL